MPKTLHLFAIIWVLGLMTMPAAWAQVQNSSQCGTILAMLQEKLEAEKTRLQNQRITIFESNIPSMGSYQHVPRKYPLVKVRRGQSTIQELITLAHEEVHVRNDEAVLKDPTISKIAPVVHFLRKSGFIHSALPFEHVRNFRMDEAEATFTESAKAFAFAKSIITDQGEQFYKNREAIDVVGDFLFTAVESQDDAFKFARAAKAILPKIIKDVSNSKMLGFKMKKQSWPYEFYDVILEIEMDDGLAPLDVYIPLHETQISITDHEAIRQKVIAVLQASLAYADIYVQKEKRVNEKTQKNQSRK